MSRLPMTGAVLAGGRSTRMGRDKALLALRDDPDEPLVARAVAKLRGIFEHVLLSAGEAPDRYAFAGVPCVADRFPGSGPLAGIAAVLAAAPTEYVFCCAVDMPFLSEPLVRHLAGLGLEGDHDVVYPRGEPLHAVYARRCLEPFTARLEAGKNKVDAAFAGLRVRVVERDEAARYDPTLASFRNVNTPEELQAARRDVRAGAPEAGRAGTPS